jgi:hypothetical protein
MLTGHATRMPQAAITSGIQGSIRVTRQGPLAGPVSDLQWGRRPKLHGMHRGQGLRSAQLHHYNDAVAARVQPACQCMAVR